jgi:hypothetical protein
MSLNRPISNLMTPFNAIYRHEVVRTWRELDGNARFLLVLFCDPAKKNPCRYGDMETCSMCGDLRVTGRVNEMFIKKRRRINNFLKTLTLYTPADYRVWRMQSNLFEESQCI